MVKLIPGWRTPSAALYDFTVRKGPYRWWGFVVGRFFFGVMMSGEE